MSGVEYVAAFGGITPGGMMEQGKTAISKSVTGSVTRGREPGPTYLAWMGGRGEPFGSFIGNYQQHNGLSEAGSTIRFLSKVKQLNPDDDIIRKPSMSGHTKRGKRVF